MNAPANASLESEAALSTAERLRVALSFLFFMPGVFAIVALPLQLFVPFSMADMVAVPFVRWTYLGLAALCLVLAVSNSRQQYRHLANRSDAS